MSNKTQNPIDSKFYRRFRSLLGKAKNPGLDNKFDSNNQPLKPNKKLLP